MPEPQDRKTFGDLTESQQKEKWESQRVEIAEQQQRNRNQITSTSVEVGLDLKSPAISASARGITSMLLAFIGF